MKNEQCPKCGTIMEKIGCLTPECEKCRDKKFEEIVRSRGGYFKQPKDRIYCRSASDGGLYTYSKDDPNVSIRCQDERIIYQEEYNMGSAAWLEKYGTG